MVSKAVTGFLCLCSWLHGATIGIAVGDSLEVYRFFSLTCGVVLTISVIWNHSAPMRRIAASLTFLVCSAFLISIVKSIAWFRTPQLDQWTALPDIGHDLFNNTFLSKDQLHIPFLDVDIDTHTIPNMLLLVIAVMTCIFIGLHPLRITITRRFLMIYATLLLTRAICAVLTFLPDSNPECQFQKVGLGMALKDLNVREVVRRMLLTLVPALVQDDRENAPSACRDIIFSGHIVMLVLCAMTWHTYYKWVPSVVNKVKLLIWTCVTAVAVLTLAQRHNYTLDVVLGTYFSITTWATYHRLANDVITGHSFSAVWLIDKVMVYPIIEWMEACIHIEASAIPITIPYGSPAGDDSSRESHPQLEPSVRLYRRDSDRMSPKKAFRPHRSTFRTSEW